MKTHHFFIACFCLCLLMVTGCSRKAVPSSITTQTTVKDSVFVIERLRVDTVKVKGDVVTITERISCDSNKVRDVRYRARGKHGAFVSVKIKDNTLRISAGCDSLKAVVTARDSLISRLRTIRHSVEKTYTKVEYRTRTIDVVCRWITSVFILVIVTIWAGKYFKFI